MASVDIKTAALILDKAFREANLLEDKTAKKITAVLTGRHKTYRYILITGLLAKSTNEQINPLSLQKGDGLNGKYDARSLCHSVIVPFETMHLQGSLGNSNEPARFEMLSTENAVRSGTDYEILSTVIEILSAIKDSRGAYKYLRHAMAILIDLHNQFIAKYSIGDALIDVSDFAQLVLDYIYKITDNSFQGEICPLVVAELEQMYLGRDYRVEAHKVNQSGASKKEVGDIDIFDKENNLVYSIEVKDKDFTAQDVLHAVAKFRAANLSSSMFVYGKKATFDEHVVSDNLKQIGREGHYCCLISILNYAKLRIADLKNITIRQFVDGLLTFAKAINAKDSTVQDIKEISKIIFK